MNKLIWNMGVNNPVKHVINVLMVLGVLVTNIVSIVIGWIVVPIALMWTKEFTAENTASNPARRFTSELIDSVWGNWDDGVTGDIYFKARYKDGWWSRFVWSAFRNPANNLGRRMGVNHKKIVASRVYGNPYVEDTPSKELGYKYDGIKYQEVLDENGRYYPMYYCILSWSRVIPWYNGNRGVIVKLGWKNFNVDGIKPDYSVVYDYSSVAVITPFKMFT